MTTTNLPAVQEKKNLPAIPVVTGANYAEVMVAQVMRDFLVINEGLDLDYVRFGDYIRIDKKGKFFDSADESNVFGDTMDVVIIQGEQRYTLWGHEKSDYKGQLIASDRDESAARAAVDMWLMNEGERAQEHHSADDVELRYLAWVVPTTTIDPEAPPQVYLLSLPYTAAIGWGKYAMAVTAGKFKAIGVPPRSTVKHVVTRLSTESVNSKRDASISYLAVKFACIGKFDPTEFGINIEAVNADLAAAYAEDAPAEEHAAETDTEAAAE